MRSEKAADEEHRWLLGTMPAEIVKLVVTDVDGVLTDGVIGINERGEEFKHFCVLDGLGVVLLRQAGIEVAFLSSRSSPIVRLRAEELSVRLHFSGVRDKRACLEEVLAAERIHPSEVCYVGDDLVDIPCLRLVGFPVAVSDARDDVKRHAELVTQAAGGRGAFRELAEHVLRKRGLWEKVLERFL